MLPPSSQPGPPPRKTGTRRVIPASVGAMSATTYGHAWDMYNAYYQVPTPLGKESHFFKDYSTYKKVSKDFAQKPNAYKYKPDYYYAQVYPLAAF